LPPELGALDFAYRAHPNAAVSLADRSSPMSTPALLDWPTVHKNMQWSVVLLLGGGLALAHACKVGTAKIRSVVVHLDQNSLKVVAQDRPRRRIDVYGQCS